MLLNDLRIAHNPDVVLTVGQFDMQADAKNPVAPAGFSDALLRNGFLRTSIQVPGKAFTLQASNMQNPDQAAGSTDWVDIATTDTGYISTDLLAKFLRVKCDTLAPGDKIYVMSIFLKS